MEKTARKNLKLGLFVIAGLGFLVLLLYIIGSSRTMFGKSFLLKARFETANGLMKGSNVRFAGIHAGSVKKVDMFNDSLVEVTLMIESGMQRYINDNAVVTIGTDGLMGVKLVNIQPAKQAGRQVKPGDVLYGLPPADPDQMLRVLNHTTADIAAIARELKLTIERVNESKVIWAVLNDESLPANLRSSLTQVRDASVTINMVMHDLQAIVNDVQEGKGSLGQIMSDTVIATGLKEAIEQIRTAALSADTLSGRINRLVTVVTDEIETGDGPANALLKNGRMANDLANSFRNIELGTRAFNENMEALKHNFLFRSYFRKLEKQKKKPN